MITKIQKITNGRIFWALLLALGIIMELCGLYFQYYLKLAPCVYCVYERALFLGFIVAGIIGVIAPSNATVRLIALLTYLFTSAYGVFIAFKHTAEIYFPDLGTSCPFKASFPAILPLDKIAPFMFNPTGMCMKLNWSLLGLGMPEWILIAFSCGVITALIMLIVNFLKRK